jgi:hypothetical protein
MLLENFISAEIRQFINFRGLKSDQRPKLVIEIGSLNQLCTGAQKRAKK